MSSWKKVTYVLSCDNDCWTMEHSDDIGDLHKGWDHYHENGKWKDVCPKCVSKMKWPERSCQHKERIYHYYNNGKRIRVCKECFKKVKGEE